MNDSESQYAKLISSFSKEQFDRVVKAFIECYWEIDFAVLVDGKGDGGTDINVFKNKAQLNIPIQVTIEKKLENKVVSDLQKIATLIKNHGYSNEFYFFCTHSPSESKKRDLENVARVEYGIRLNFIDPKFIASQLGFPKFNMVRSIIRNHFSKILDNHSPIFSNAEKLKFELILYGRETTEIKNKIFDAFILLEIYNSTKCKVEDLEKKIHQMFDVKSAANLCKRELHKLYELGKINYLGTDKSEVTLTLDELLRINNSKEDLDLKENSLIQSVCEILAPFKIENSYAEIINGLRKVFSELHKRDLYEIKGSGDTPSDITAIRNFVKLLASKINDEELAHSLATHLVDTCRDNDFLQRISAGELFSNLVEEPELETYLNISKRVIYLDTSVALHLLCVLYNEKSSFGNIYFRTTVDLWNLIRSDKRLTVIFSNNYLSEVVYHITDAFKMLELYKYDFFLKLGKSNNVFLNFYEYLNANHELPNNVNTFSDFLGDFGFRFNELNAGRATYFVRETVKKYFEMNSITVQSFEDYSDTQKNVFSEVKKEVEINLLARHDARPEETINRDVTMLCHLFDKTKHDSVDPIFLTWDNIFLDVRRKYHKEHPSASFWHLFRPAKFLDHFSLLSLRINSENLSMDILSLIESEFNLKKKVKSLKDVIVRILDVQSTSGIQLVKEIASLQENEVYALKARHTSVQDPDFQEYTSVEYLMSDLFEYYKNKKGKYSIDDLKECTSDEGNLVTLLEYLKKEIVFFNKKGKWDQEIHNNLDTIIKWHKQKAKL